MIRHIGAQQREAGVAQALEVMQRKLR